MELVLVIVILATIILGQRQSCALGDFKSLSCAREEQNLSVPSGIFGHSHIPNQTPKLLLEIPVAISSGWVPPEFPSSSPVVPIPVPVVVVWLALLRVVSALFWFWLFRL